MTGSLVIRPLTPSDRAEWLRMRLALWPDASIEEHLAEMDEIQRDPQQPVFVAERSGAGLSGFLEAAVHVNTYGCDTRPVGYIEGWYVDPDLRFQGVGRRLVEAAEVWAVGQGFREMASDCEIDNLVSLQAHMTLGYEEVERLIHFRKVIGGDS